MRSITITYDYDGPEEDWLVATSEFIEAINSDPEVTGKFTYQVAVADNGITRIHWGRWDNAETLATLQSRDFFKAFAEKVGAFGKGAQVATGTEVVNKTAGW